jgi:hypothetical protein
MMGVEMLYQTTKKGIDSLGDLHPGAVKISFASREADVVHRITLCYTPDDVTRRSREDNGSVSY